MSRGQFSALSKVDILVSVLCLGAEKLKKWHINFVKFCRSMFCMINKQLFLETAGNMDLDADLGFFSVFVIFTTKVNLVR